MLAEHAAGHRRGAIVEVDGQQMRVVASVWGPAGPPIGYHVVPASSSGWLLDWVRVDADAVSTATSR